ncbi:hypothetical protein E4L96_03230 [Massilia arenosa]|uniref:Uncharacterized protein n=1 Tax=Zemynaea arenosa TaxID=2561931 RepID=A0A4Y9SR55_9BURK|nr:hypothetical protein [Massilia arenosa]TFW27829.1 hypothetical protein E4L96_03230 [Massilia arenosa]
MAACRHIRQTLTAVILLGFCLGAEWAESAPLPKEVQRFIDRREACDHFRGEDWDGDKQRKKEILRELDRYCTGTDKALARLRTKYAHDPAVITRLKDFEDVIEAPPEPKPARHKK